MIENIAINIPLKNDICCKYCGNVLSNTSHIDICGEVSTKERTQYLLFIQDGHLNKDILIPKKMKLSNDPCTFLMYLQAIHCVFCDTEVGTLYKTANIYNRFALGKTALFFKDTFCSGIDKQYFLQRLRQQIKIERSQTSINIPCKTDICKYTQCQIKNTLFQAYKKLEQRGKQLLKRATDLSKQDTL